jgi:hypothetical protein
MYLRHTTVRKDGKVHRYWRLVRSVRVGRRVIQQTVAHLGELDERGRLEARALARHLIGAPERAQLFDDGRKHVTVPVRLKGIAIERSGATKMSKMSTHFPLDILDKQSVSGGVRGPTVGRLASQRLKSSPPPAPIGLRGVAVVQREGAQRS